MGAKQASAGSPQIVRHKVQPMAGNGEQLGFSGGQY